MTGWEQRLVDAPPREAVMRGIRAALAAEVAKPRRSWRRDVAWLLAATIGLAGLIALVAGIAGEYEPGVVAARWLSLLVVGATGPLAVTAAIRPGGGALRVITGLLALAGAVVLVVTRPLAVGDVHQSPEWVCTASHLGVAVPAMVVASLALRNIARSLPRALAAGVAVGTTGALLGELLCGGAAAHIALFHLTSWLLATVVVTLVSLSLSRRSFAP